jgi:phage gp37-like protein
MLTFRNARAVLETALVDHLRLGLARRLPPVDSLVELAAATPHAVPDGALRFVREQQCCFAWQPWSIEDADSFIVRPDALTPTAPGRWVRATTHVATGYVRRIELHNEDEDEETINARLLGDKPALLISFEGARHRAVSNRPGALYWYIATYSILAVSTTMRGEQAPRHGSPRAAELAGDPGTAAMLGDVKELLAGSSLNLDEVERIELGDEKPVIVALAKRTVVEQLEVTIWASLGPSDETVPLSIAASTDLAGRPMPDLDDADVVVRP